MSELLKQLESRRLQLIQEHEEHLDAIERLIAIEKACSGDSVELNVPGRFISFRSNQRGIGPDSLAGQILDVMSLPGRRDWTSGQVWESLQRKTPVNGEYRLSDDELKAKNSISATMGQLWRSDRIEQIRPSRGAEPAIYRLRKGSKGQEPAEAGS